jgi:hypothetical protein
MLPFFFVKQSIEVALKKRPSPLTWREKMQAFFDFFSPLYQHRYEPAEISSWFKEQGFQNVVVCNVGSQGFGVRGDRADIRAEQPDFATEPPVAKLRRMIAASGTN